MTPRNLLANLYSMRIFCRLTVILLAVPAFGQQSPKAVSHLLGKNCLDCHDSSSKEGDLDLESLKLNLADPDNFYLWERVYDRVRNGEMPPDEALDKKDKSGFLTSLHDTLKQSDAARIDAAGRVPARRLTRAQYERNVCDLLGINVPLSDYLPVDSLTNGFDTVSKSQQISNHLMAAYLQSADVALDAAFKRILTDEKLSKIRFDWSRLRRDEDDMQRESEGRPKHKDIVSWSTNQNFYARLPATSVPESGRYRIRIQVEAVNCPPDRNVWCSVKSGVCNAKASTLYWIGGFEATKETSEHEFEAWIHKGHKLQIRPRDRGLRRATPRQISKPAGTIEPMGIPGVAIKWIEMERIESNKVDARKALIGDLKLRPIAKRADNATGEENQLTQQFEIVSKDPKQDLQKLIQAFAQRAFRRPVTQEELKPYFDFAVARLDADGSLHDALRAAYRAVLCSSRFLYFEESPGVLDDYALANRLSHFLWGLGPDQELQRLASAGRLSNPTILRQQTDRLLDDSRSMTFIKEFTDQWLMLYEINSTTPDGKLYPEYDDVLHHSLTQESHAFVRELFAKNLPATNIVDSDFTFLNSRLARHYGIEWPGGLGLQRIKLEPDDHRGGVITHASVMKVTANGTTTSPVTRGVWMLERIMGQHVPPPPANVPAVEPDIRGATNIRDQLNKHRNLESCAACHVKIDPPGFALESFDVIGGWREKYRIVEGEKRRKSDEGPAVDPSHKLTTGETFQNIKELKHLLVQKPKPLARNLASQFVTYATGAVPTFADRESIDAIVSATETKKYGVRSLLHEVIQSSMFRNK